MFKHKKGKFTQAQAKFLKHKIKNGYRDGTAGTSLEPLPEPPQRDGRCQDRFQVGDVFMIPERLSLTPVPTCGFVCVYVIQPENVRSALFHPGCCTGERIPFRLEITQ